MSQFSKLFAAVKNTPKDKEEAAAAEKKKTPRRKSPSASSAEPKKPVAVVKKREAARANPAPKVEAEKPPPQKAGKRVGKSSSAEYTQVLTYIRKDTHKEIKKALIDDPHERDLSELVEGLLTNWLTATAARD